MMSSDDYRSESFETTKSSEEALQRSESDQYTDHLFPLSEVEREIADEHYDDFKTYVEMLVEIGDEQLKPLQLTDCYTSERPGMYLEILPKIIFETVETETGIEEIDFPKPIFRLTIDQGTIASVEHSSSSAQTLRNNLLNSWSQYEPRLCPDEDCSSITKTESFLSFIKNAEERVFDSLIQNKVADSFVRELKSLEGECSDIESSKESVLTMKGSFLCFKGNQKQIIKSISWHPIFKDIFIVSTLRNNKFEEKTSNSVQESDDSCIFYVWNCKNQFMPKAFVEYFDEVLLHMFNPTMPNVVIGGSLNGQLVLWDIDEDILKETSNDEKNESFISVINAEPPTIHHSAVSNPDNNHTRSITDFAWLPNHIEVSSRGNVKLCASNESYQIATCGSDGILKFWDLRAAFQSKPGFSQSKMFRHLDGKWEPFHSVDILAENEKKFLSITRFAFKEPIKVVKPEELLQEEEDYPEDKPKYQISTEFYAGCDDGCILCGNFKLYRDDAGKFKSYIPKIFKSPHSGPITTISVSPFFPDIFISTGSRTVAIWHHDILATPIFSRDMHTYVTSAEWSDTRPALFILGYQDGSIEMWNMLDNIYDPIIIHYVSTTSVMAISIQTVTEEEHYAAVGDSEGIVYILSLPPSLWMPIDSELKLMAEFIEKEGIRVKLNVTDIKSEKELKSIKKEETGKTVSPHDTVIVSEDLQKSYAEFLELERIQLKYLGILQEKEENEEDED